MLDHVSISVRDLAAAAPFYDAALGALGHAPLPADGDRLRYGTRNSAEDDGHTYLSVVEGADGAGATRHWAFRAITRGQVDAFYAAALAAGGSDDGPPGPRSEYHPDYYAAFVRDLDGNRLEAVCHRAE
jgi:catechol 2,3-dioxygenase-like lactoylglutathione lyase family enzyme